MNRNAIVGAVVVVVAAGAWLLWPKAKEEAPPEPPPIAAPVEAPEHHAVPPVADTTPLPDLENSDAALAASATGLFGSKFIAQWLVPNEVVRHLVVTIDNLPRKKYAERQKPINAVPGRFAVTGTDDARTIGPENAARYAPLAETLQGLDMQRVAAEYFRLYPLFQQTYRDLGYPDGYFNNRLVAVIDDLLAAPTVSEPIKLTQPNVMYEFADPKLEALSAGQKTMIRMGASNAAIVKIKLRELRAAIANHK